MKLAVVTATLNPERARACVQSWRDTASNELTIFTVQGEMGVVPAFAKGVQMALAMTPGGADVIACFHDDLRIDQDGWDEDIEEWLKLPYAGLAGFSGCNGLGTPDIYQSPYYPGQLARQGFFSDLEDAEVHGSRLEIPARSACADGFSQIGRREFFDEAWPYLMKQGVIHHAYDSWLGCLAKRWGWDTWYLPVRCKHFGGQTAVGNPRYAEWAKAKGGDQEIWAESHRKMYEDCRGELPLRIRR